MSQSFNALTNSNCVDTLIVDLCCKRNVCNCCTQIPCCCNDNPVSTDNCDICNEQFKYVVQQLLGFYVNDDWTIYFISGRSVPETPDAIVRGINNGLLYELDTNQFLNICQITYIAIDTTSYNAGIQYLPAPLVAPCFSCSYSIYDTINGFTAGDVVNLNVNGTTISGATVISNQYGMVVLSTVDTLYFIKSCFINSITNLG